MANSPEWNDATIIAGVAAMGALCNNGTLRIYTGSQPALNGALSGTLLATLTFGATAFGTPTASGGTVTAAANSITSGTAAASNTAGYFALVKSDTTTVVATGSVGTSGADLNLNSLAISSGATVSCSAFSLTQSQS